LDAGRSGATAQPHMVAARGGIDDTDTEVVSPADGQGEIPPEPKEEELEEEEPGEEDHGEIEPEERELDGEEAEVEEAEVKKVEVEEAEVEGPEVEEVEVDVVEVDVPEEDGPRESDIAEQSQQGEPGISGDGPYDSAETYNSRLPD